MNNTNINNSQIQPNMSFSQPSTNFTLQQSYSGPVGSQTTIINTQQPAYTQFPQRYYSQLSQPNPYSQFQPVQTQPVPTSFPQQNPQQGINQTTGSEGKINEFGEFQKINEINDNKKIKEILGDLIRGREDFYFDDGSSEKRDNRFNIIFYASTGHKTILRVRRDLKICDLIRIYISKIDLNKEIAEKQLIFILNGFKLDIKSDEEIYSFRRNNIAFKDNTVINVIDQKGITGAKLYFSINGKNY